MIFCFILIKVQRELCERGNEYEIMDFIKSQIKMSIGIERAPKPVSILKELEGDKEEKDNEIEVEEEKDPNITELPKKVDEFMSYINRVYFDGELDQGGKQILKADLNRLDNNDTNDFNYEDFNDQPTSTRPRRKILITT